MANYPKTGQVVARYTGEWPCTRDPYKTAGVPIRQLIRIPSGVPADTGNPARRLSAGTGRSGHSGGLPDSPDECQWCGKPGRLREVLRASIEHPLPTVGEEDEGLWWLHFTDGAEGPFPSAHAAWDYWHGNPPTPARTPAGGGGEERA